MRPRSYQLWALGLAVVYFVVLWVTAPAVGFVRDEGYYFKAAELYSGWFGVLFSSRFLEAFSDAEILKHFSYNSEHPPLVKLTQGLTFHVFHRGLGWASPSTGFRAAGFFFGGLSIMATFWLGRQLVSPPVGLLAAAMLAMMPRYFFDAHLACFDVAITAMWTLSIHVFLWALRAPSAGASRRAVAASVVFGLALATKLNALFLPFLFVLWWLVEPPAGLKVGWSRGPSGGRDLELPPVPGVLVACALVSPLVFFATWPYLWHDPIDRTWDYLRFHLHHEHYPASYFHELLVAPPFPWHFPVVMTALTIPSPVLALGGVGALVAGFRGVRRRRLPDIVLLTATLLPIALIALPTTPVFGGVKHWYNALPTLCILAARSTWWIFGALGDRLRAWRPKEEMALVTATAVVTVGLALGPGLLGIIRSHPDGIGYYNEIAGGFRGGAELGMQRGFWGGLAHPRYVDTLPRLADGRGRVFFNRTNYDAFRMYQRQGIVPRAMYYGYEARGSAVGIHFEQPEHGEQEGAIWSAIGSRPVAGVYRHNVTLIQIYAVPSTESPAKPPAKPRSWRSPESKRQESRDESARAAASPMVR